MTRLRNFVGNLLGPLLRLRVLSLRTPEHRGRRYLLTAVTGIVTIILIAYLAVRTMPDTYTSRWTLILPGAGSGANLVLQGIGQVSSNSASPYASISRSPRVNYREIATSETVLSAAAAIAEVPASDFGKPRIKLIQQSSLISFSISASTPELALRKADALNTALRQVLNQLRADELALRESGLSIAVEGFAKRMEDVRADLLAHQTKSSLISKDQLVELNVSVESVQRQLIKVTAETERQASFLRRLTESLNTTEESAAAAVLLHADEAIRRLIDRYMKARTTMIAKQGAFGPNHPRMRDAAATVRSIEAEFKERAFKLLGSTDADVLRLLLLDVNDATGALIRELVSAAARLSGMEAERAALERELDELRHALQEQAADAAKLDDLERDHQIAEAIFSSALARLDTGKADLFVSYPLVQTITPPAAPDSADRRSQLFAIAGAAMAIICFLFGLVLLWVRTPPCR